MPAYDEVKNAALELPFEARAKLVADILTSLEASQEEIDSAWRAEIELRLREIEEGKVDLIPGEQVMNELRAQLRS